MATKPTSVPAHQPAGLSSLCLALAEHAPLPMAMVEGAEHILRYVNPAFCRLLDNPPEKLLGISFGKILPENHECAAALDRVLITGKPESFRERQHPIAHPVFWSFTMWPVWAGKLPVGVMIQVTGAEQVHLNALAMNEALMLGSLRQHELTEAAELLNVQLQKEIAERKRAETALRESEERYHGLFNAIDEGFCVIEKVEGGVGESTDFRYLEANPAFEVQSGASGMVGKTIRQALPDEPEGWCSIYDTVLRTGEPIRFEREFVTHGRVLELYAFRVEDETHRRVAVIFKDITERKRADEARARLAAIVDSSNDAIIGKDLNSVITSWNAGAERLFGYTAQEAIGQPVGMLIPRELCDEEPRIIERIRRGEHIEHYETVRCRKDGTSLDVSLTVSPIVSGLGNVVGASKIARDITGRKQAEAARREAEKRQRLLTDELAHRGKNLLAVVVSIAARSLSGKRSLAEAREVLIQRLHALARNQSLLITQGFEGAPLGEVIRLEFESFSDRIEAVGPPVMLNPRVAQTFALVVHELATNATKHGALSGPRGHIAIRWSIEGAGPEARFKFQWQELDGPPVVPPTRQGFGRILLEKAVAQEFGAPATIDFAPEGLSYEIDAPLSFVTGSLGSEEAGVFKFFGQV